MKHIQTFENFLNEANVAELPKPEILTPQELSKKKLKEIQDIQNDVNAYLDNVYDRYKKAKGQEKKDLNYSAADIVSYSDTLKTAILNAEQDPKRK